MKDMEKLYAARFGTPFIHVRGSSQPSYTHPERGDDKKARERLRAGEQHYTHHFSTFCSGLMIGIGLPALVSGIRESE
jgi:hypothetical protein